jgi:hypothetical protein
MEPPAKAFPAPTPAPQRCCKEYQAALVAWLEEHVAVVDERGAWMDRW